ncbi:MAG: hypothetical protein Q9210_000565 [Variospora velana]
MSASVNEPTNQVYVWQESAEDLENYRAGGYHPVQLGDDFSNGRYHVVHKLGRGSYSTVWLARDNVANKYVALKIVTSEFSATNKEKNILFRLEERKKSRADLGGHYVLGLQDDFMIEGPNGRHACLVSEPLGCSVGVSREASSVWMFQLQVARAMVAKLIMGVCFLHSCSVVHGDLHINNIMLGLPDIQKLSVDELYKRYGSPAQQPVKRLDGAALDETAPPYTVSAFRSGIACENVTDSDITIADFGEAYLSTDEPRPYLNTPILLCPPEVLIEKGTIGMPADIWTLACTVFEILGRGTLFEDFADPDFVMGQTVSVLGMPPDHMWTAWHGRSKFFLEDGSRSPNSRRGHSAGSRPLRQKIAKARGSGEGFHEGEEEALEAMLAGMLRWDPQERAQIEDVIQSEWMQRFGKPAVAASGTDVSLQSSAETEEPAVAALGTEVSLPSSPKAEKSPKEDLLEESKDSKVGRSLQSSTEMKKSSYEDLLEESKDLRIERLKTPTELSSTERGKSLNEDILVEAKDTEVERIEIPKTPSHIEIEKSHSKVSLEEVRDVKVDRMETLAKSE